MDYFVKERGDGSWDLIERWHDGEDLWAFNISADGTHHFPGIIGPAGRAFVYVPTIKRFKREGYTVKQINSLLKQKVVLVA